MGLIHYRDSAEIRRLALETAITKYAEGCVSCAQSYLELARTHGATDHELGQVAERATRTPAATEGARPVQRLAERVARRKLLRVAGTALAVGVAGNLMFAGKAHAASPTPSPAASPSPTPSGTPGTDPSSQSIAVPGFFGVDSCTSIVHGLAAGMPLHFYVGELGATQYGIECFDPNTAAHVTPAYTHGYWGICGPNAMPTGMTDPGAWGQQQALLAIAAWNSNPVTGGRTLFADVERGFGGWGKPATLQDNVALLNGFLQTVAQAGFVPGVYINASERDLYFPTDYVAPIPFVYWFAGGSLAGKMAGPCQQGDTLHPTFTAWTTQVQFETFGGMQAVIWQFWLSGFGCNGDFNYSPQSGYSAFLPTPAPVAPNTGSSAPASNAPIGAPH